MAKRLIVLIGMLALLLTTAVPAFAQQGPVTAIGVLGQPDTSGPDPEPTYPLTDEETGTTYVLVSGFVDLTPFAGQRVAIEGVPIGGADDALPALNVTRIQPVDGPPPGPAPDRTATFDFELTVKGEPPEDTRFFGVVPAEGCISAPLTDPDGDGVFTASLDVPRFPPGPAPPDAEPVSLPVQIVQANSGAGPCNPTTVIKDFGIVPADDDTFRAKVNFKKNRGDTTTPGSNSGGSSGDRGSGNGAPSSGGSGATANNGSGSGSSSDKPSSSSGEMKVLPRTGGALPTLGIVGALLVAGGLLVRRAAR